MKKPLDNYRKDIQNSTPKNKIIAVGKYAYGDAIWMYNILHNTAKTLKRNVELEVHWYWDRSYYHSVDDQENIIDQTDYILKFYEKADVTVTHVYNSEVKKQNILTKGSKLIYGADPLDVPRSNWWCFDQRLKLPPIPKKVVVWDSYSNADASYKEILQKEDWDCIKNNLRNCGYTVIEVCYRTPISELMYHINTASSCIGYSGLCYQIANNWGVPCLVVSDRNLVNLYSPCVLKMSEKSIIHSLTRNYDTYGESMLTEYCDDKFSKLQKWIEMI